MTRPLCNGSGYYHPAFPGEKCSCLDMCLCQRCPGCANCRPKCETCGGRGEVVTGPHWYDGSTFLKPCPDCAKGDDDAA